MANSFYDEYRERGFVYIQVVIDDGTGDGKVTWEDAQYWAYTMDFDGAGSYTPPLRILVLADTDGKLWSEYVEPCGSDLACQLTCHVTPQTQIFDQGGVTVDDGCSRRPGQSECQTGAYSCGFPEPHIRRVLDKLLPKGCGGALPY